MEQRSLRVIEADKTFFRKITNSITKLLIPTKVGINGLIISLKRTSLLKAYEEYKKANDIDDVQRKDALLTKYEDAFALYLESIDKFIMDSLYKKVKNNSATEFERNALAKYYTIVSLKEKQYIEYKYKKQKYLLEIDYETVASLRKETLLERYNTFYVEKMDSLYKGILKNYSVQLSDTMSTKLESREKIYEKIFGTLEEYLANVLIIKLQNDKTNQYKEILEEYDKYDRFSIGKLDEKDKIEKKMILLGISRFLFTHSLPLVVAEQCYVKLIKEARQLVLDTINTKKQEKSYKMLISLIEDYNVKLLSTKVYWDKPEVREDYKKFWENYLRIDKLKEDNFKAYSEQKEILFLKYDLKFLNKSKKDYSKIVKIYKEKLVELGAMKQFKNSCKTMNGKLLKKSVVAKAE